MRFQPHLCILLRNKGPVSSDFIAFECMKRVYDATPPALYSCITSNFTVKSAIKQLRLLHTALIGVDKGFKCPKLDCMTTSTAKCILGQHSQDAKSGFFLCLHAHNLSSGSWLCLCLDFKALLFYHHYKLKGEMCVCVVGRS